MFTYCNNNPGNYSDYSGNRPHAMTSSITNVILYCCYEGGTPSKWSESPKEVSFREKMLQAGQLFLECLDFSMGVGQGLYVELEACDFIGVNLGFYGNYGTINYSNGEFYTGQEFYSGATATLLWYEFGAAEHMFTNNSGESSKSSFLGMNTQQDNFNLFSCGFYPLLIGFSVSLGFDTVSFFEGLDKIF